MSHEKSVTEQLPKGRWANFATVGRKRLLGGKTFKTKAQAVSAAKKRSASAGNKKRQKRPARPAP